MSGYMQHSISLATVCRIVKSRWEEACERAASTMNSSRSLTQQMPSRPHNCTPAFSGFYTRAKAFSKDSPSPTSATPFTPFRVFSQTTFFFFTVPKEISRLQNINSSFWSSLFWLRGNEPN